MRQAESFTGSIWSYWAMQDEGWHVKVLQILRLVSFRKCLDASYAFRLRSWLKTHVDLSSDDLRVEVWEEMIDVNRKGVLYGIAAALEVAQQIAQRMREPPLVSGALGRAHSLDERSFSEAAPWHNGSRRLGT
jgi:hypothetical protein